MGQRIVRLAVVGEDEPHSGRAVEEFDRELKARRARMLYDVRSDLIENDVDFRRICRLDYLVDERARVRNAFLDGREEKMVMAVFSVDREEVEVVSNMDPDALEILDEAYVPASGQNEDGAFEYTGSYIP